MAERQFGWVKSLSAGDKVAITAACERLIADKPKPRLLPEIRPNEFNYPVDIFG